MVKLSLGQTIGHVFTKQIPIENKQVYQEPRYVCVRVTQFVGEHSENCHLTFGADVCGGGATPQDIDRIVSRTYKCLVL